MDDTAKNVVPLGRGDFFAVDRRAWAKACALGINAPIAYLVLARGSGGDNRTTSWSTHAIEERTNIPRHKAKAAVKALVEAGLIRQDKGGSRPRYFILPEPDNAEWTWIPNALVDGAAGETAPIELVRQAQRPAAIRLLIDLYHAQALQLDCGVHWRTIRNGFDRHKVGERGPFVVWGFKSSGKRLAWTALAKPHLTGRTEKVDDGAGGKRAQDTGWPVFWSALETLELTGLVQFVAHVIDADTDEGSVLHPYAIGNGEPGERAIADAADVAARAMLSPELRDWATQNRLWLAPFAKHVGDVQLVGLARLTYRARTTATAAWYDIGAWEGWVRHYERIAQEQAAGQTSSPAFATSREDQR